MSNAPANTGDVRPRFKLYSVDELMGLPNPEWLVDNLLPKAALLELYGQPGIGKSFLALAWALSIAAGVPWLGREVKRGDVVYISAEGGSGLKKRIAAWRTKHRGTKLNRFKAILEPVKIPKPEEVNSVVHAIKEASCNPCLVVIDTLARCFGSGDENATKDMNAFVAGLDQIKKAFPHATVLVVHHSGKAASRGERGSTVLRAAADTVMELAGGKNAMTLKCEKQKDWEPFDAIAIGLRIVERGGQTSCVIEAGTVRSAPDKQGSGNNNDTKALEALLQVGTAGMSYSQWRQASGLVKSTFKNVRKRLLAKKLVHQDGKQFRIATDNEGQGQGRAKT